MSRRLTADKREIKDSLKLPSATSFMLRTLSEMSKWGIARTKNYMKLFKRLRGG